MPSGPTRGLQPLVEAENIYTAIRSSRAPKHSGVLDYYHALDNF